MHIYAHYCASVLGDELRAKQIEIMYLRYPDMAQELGVSLRTLKNWVADRLIPYVKIRKVILFEPTKVRAALEKFERKPVTAKH
jgi:excisionase family DNA binding protein